MVLEEHAVQVPDLTLVPARGGQQSAVVAKKRMFVFRSATRCALRDTNASTSTRDKDNAPVCTPEDRRCTGYRVDLARIGLDANSATVLHAEEMVDDLEALVTLREIYSADVHARLVLALGVVAEEGEDRDGAGRGYVERELVFEDGELLHVFGKTLE